MKKFFQYIDINESLVLQTNRPILTYIERSLHAIQNNKATVRKVTSDSIDFSVPFIESGNRASIFQGISFGKLVFIHNLEGVVVNYQISILPIRILAIVFILFGFIVPAHLFFTSSDVELFPLYLLVLVGGFVMAALAYFVGMFLVIWRFEEFLLKSLITS